MEIKFMEYKVYCIWKINLQKSNFLKLKNIRNCFGKFQGANILWSKILNMSLSLAFDTDFVMMTWKICWNGYRFKTTISVSLENNCSRGFFVVFLLLLSLFFVVFFFFLLSIKTTCSYLENEKVCESRLKSKKPDNFSSFLAAKTHGYHLILVNWTSLPLSVNRE